MHGLSVACLFIVLSATLCGVFGFRYILSYDTEHLEGSLVGHWYEMIGGIVNA